MSNLIFNFYKKRNEICGEKNISNKICSIKYLLLFTVFSLFIFLEENKKDQKEKTWNKKRKRENTSNIVEQKEILMHKNPEAGLKVSIQRVFSSCWINSDVRDHFL